MRIFACGFSHASISTSISRIATSRRQTLTAIISQPTSPDLSLADFSSVRSEMPRGGPSLAGQELVDEMPRQVFADGVDYEASCAYHRFVFELFLWPALFRQAVGSNVPTEYSDRLRKMARFTATYSRADGTSPLWGDADDARALPFAGPAIGDHRYVVGLAAIAFKDPDLAAWFDGPRSELAWVFGMDRARELPRSARLCSAFVRFSGRRLLHHARRPFPRIHRLRADRPRGTGWPRPQ